MPGTAIISPCGLYRTRLERQIDTLCMGPIVAICGVNPSTADAETNDATIRKDLGFAYRHGWSKIIKGNLFAYRAKDVRELATVDDPIGPDNDAELERIFNEAELVIAAWGASAKLPRRLRERWRDVKAIADRIGKPLFCFGTCKDGQPLHPLMIPYESEIRRWTAPEFTPKTVNT